MVNVTIYSIHGSYGSWIVSFMQFAVKVYDICLARLTFDILERSRNILWTCIFCPIGSMYARYGNIYHPYTPVMLAYIYIPAPWIRHGCINLYSDENCACSLWSNCGKTDRSTDKKTWELSDQTRQAVINSWQCWNDKKLLTHKTRTWYNSVCICIYIYVYIGWFS